MIDEDHVEFGVQITLRIGSYFTRSDRHFGDERIISYFADKSCSDDAADAAVDDGGRDPLRFAEPFQRRRQILVRAQVDGERVDSAVCELCIRELRAEQFEIGFGIVLGDEFCVRDPERLMTINGVRP